MNPKGPYHIYMYRSVIKLSKKSNYSLRRRKREGSASKGEGRTWSNLSGRNGCDTWKERRDKLRQVMLPSVTWQNPSSDRAAPSNLRPRSCEPYGREQSHQERHSGHDGLLGSRVSRDKSEESGGTWGIWSKERRDSNRVPAYISKNRYCFSLALGRGHPDREDKTQTKHAQVPAERHNTRNCSGTQLSHIFFNLYFWWKEGRTAAECSKARL